MITDFRQGGNEPFYDVNVLNSARTSHDEAQATYKSFTSIRGDMFFKDDIIDKWTKLYFKWPTWRTHEIVVKAMFSVLKPDGHTKDAYVFT